MFLDFKISNYRSIKDAQTISFEATEDMHLEDYYVVKVDKYRILKIGMILGANASGKSNVLRAFSLFRRFMLFPCETKASEIRYDKFALDKEMADVDSEMTVNFLCSNTKYEYSIKFNNRYISFEELKAHPFGNLREHIVFRRSLDSESMVSDIQWGSKYKSASANDLKVNLLPNRTVFGSYQNSNVDIPWMRDIIEWVSSYILPNIGPAAQGLDQYTSKQIYSDNVKKEHVVRLLQKADVGVCDFSLKKEETEISPQVVDMLLNSNTVSRQMKSKLKEEPINVHYEIRLEHNGSQGKIPFDYKQESRGTQRYYELSSILLKLINEAHFVAIDELDSQMHPDLFQHFLNLYLTNSDKSQLLITTHIREFLDDRDLYRDDAVWFTEKEELGATQLYSLADFGSDILRNNSNRYNAYRSGRLGAIPHLGDIYVEK